MRVSRKGLTCGKWSEQLEQSADIPEEYIQLFWGLLERGLLDATGTLSAGDVGRTMKRRARREAVQWLLDRSEPTGIGFTFEQVCTILGLDSETLRDAAILAIETGKRWRRMDIRGGPELVRMLRA